MIRDSLGLVRAALASQTDWKASLSSSGSWVIKKSPRQAVQPIEPLERSRAVDSDLPEPWLDRMSESVHLFV